MTPLTSQDGSGPMAVVCPAPATDETQYDVRNTAVRLGISESSVRRLIGSGALGHLRLGGLYRVTEGQCRAYLASCIREPVPSTERTRIRRQRRRPRSVDLKRAQP